MARNNLADIPNVPADALGALWLASRRRLNTIAIGFDSISDMNSDPGITNAKGHMSQARAIAENRFYFDNALNFGNSGDSSAQALARFSAVIAAQPSRIAMMVGTNDFAKGISKEGTITNWLAMLDMAERAGIPVDIMPILPRSYDTDAGGANLAALRLHRYFVNARLREIAAARGPSLGGFIPLDDVLTDKANANGDPINLAMYNETDGNLGKIHLLGFGATVAGILIADYYSKIIPLPPRRIVSNADLFLAGAGNPKGALNSNPMMTGGGGAAGTGVTSTGGTGIADTYRVERSTGSTMTATCTKEPIVHPVTGVTIGEKQVITLGGGGAGANNEMIRLTRPSNLSTAGMTAGQKVEAVIKVEQSGLVNVCNIKVQLVSSVAGQFTSLGGTGTTGDREYPTLTREFETPTITITNPGTEVVVPHLYIQGDCSAATGGAVSGTVKVSHMFVAVD